MTYAVLELEHGYHGSHSYVTFEFKTFEDLFKDLSTITTKSGRVL